MPKRHSTEIEFQIVLELLQAQKTAGQVAK